MSTKTYECCLLTSIVTCLEEICLREWGPLIHLQTFPFVENSAKEY